MVGYNRTLMCVCEYVYVCVYVSIAGFVPWKHKNVFFYYHIYEGMLVVQASIYQELKQGIYWCPWCTNLLFYT